MRIQQINNLTSQINSKKNAEAPDNSFEHVLKGHIKNDSHDEKSAGQTHTVSKNERTDYAWRLTISDTRQVKLTGLQELISDAFSNTGAQIMQEIESLCEDETGVGIDMRLLDEFLELYTDVR